MTPSIEKIIGEIVEEKLKLHTAEIIRSIETIVNNQEKQSELINVKEACEFLKVHETTLWRWRKEGRINAYCIKGTRFYKKSEIMNALKPLRGSSDK